MSARFRNLSLCLFACAAAACGSASDRTSDMSTGSTGDTNPTADMATGTGGNGNGGDLAVAGNGGDLAVAGNGGDLAVAGNGGDMTLPGDMALPPLPPAAAQLTDDAAHAICRAMFRCCDDGSQGQWFSGYTGYYSADPVIKMLTDQVPPKATLTPDSCPGLVKQMFDEVPFGPWLRQVQAGRVGFDAAEAKKCIDALDHATCGDQIAAALWDGTCLSFNPPEGGDRQRRMFPRTQKVGDGCAPVRDGEGSMFYGTCDPQKAFCCVVDPSRPNDGCTTPKADSIGTCQAAGAVNDACREFPPPISLCATGLECDQASNVCMAPKTTPLALGNACVDANNQLLGVCKDSWCDFFGTKQCSAYKADGADCTGGDECQSRACNDKKCGAPIFCIGSGQKRGVTTLPVTDIKNPVSVVSDGKSYLWASFDDNTVRKIDLASGAVLLTLGTPGTAGATDNPPLFKAPAGLALDDAGVLYVGDVGNHAVRKVTPNGATAATVTTLAKDANLLVQPADVVVGDGGALYVADSSACAIRKLVGSTLSTVIDNNDALDRPCLGGKRIYFPRGLAWDGAHKQLYVAETLGHRIDVIDLGAATPTVTLVAGSDAGTSGAVDGAGDQARFNMPTGIVLDGNGGLLVAEQANHRIRKVVLAATAAAATVSTVAGNGAGDVDGDLATARFNGPSDVARGAAPAFLVADRANSQIRVLIP